MMQQPQSIRIDLTDSEMEVFRRRTTYLQGFADGVVTALERLKLSVSQEILAARLNEPPKE